MQKNIYVYMLLYINQSQQFLQAVDTKLIPIYSNKLFFIMIKKDIKNINNNDYYYNTYQYLLTHPKYNTIKNLVFCITLVFFIQIFTYLILKKYKLTKYKGNDYLMEVIAYIYYILKIEDKNKYTKIEFLIKLLYIIYNFFQDIYIIKNYFCNRKNIINYFFTLQNLFLKLFLMIIQYLISYYVFKPLILTFTKQSFTKLIENIIKNNIINYIYQLIFLMPSWYIYSYIKKKQINSTIEKIKMCNFIVRRKQLFIPVDCQCNLENISDLF